jgi:tetratricopeptide (TPR) repeat protein
VPGRRCVSPRATRFLLLLLTATCAITFGARRALAQASTYTPSPADSLRQAQDSIVTVANAAIAHDSTLVDEYAKIIAVHKTRKRYEEELAIAALMQGRNPESSLANFIYGDAELDNGAPEKALDPLKRALIIDPAFVRARATLAEAYTMLKIYDTALTHLDTALRSNPRYAQAHVQRAALLTQLGRDSEAVESYRAASELLPDTFGPWLKLGRALIKVGNYDDAIDALTYAMSLNNASPDALYLFAEANEKGGHTAEAVHAYEQFMLHFPTDRRALDAERSARALGGGRP